MKRLGLLAGLAVVAVMAGDARASEPTYTGVLEVGHADAFDAGYSVDTLRLHTDGGTFAVADPDRQLSRFAGRRITLAARREGGTLAGARVAGEPADSSAPERPLGERRVAVLLISSAEDTARRWDPAITDEVVFGAGDSVASFFRTASAGRATVDGEIHGWYTGAFTTCDRAVIMQQAMAAARADGVDLEDYDHVTAMFPRRSDCGFSGSAFIGGREAWINGDQRDIRVIAHELGHNFGMHHAAAEVCTQDDAPVTLSKQCVVEEYGDPLDVMGSAVHLFIGARRVGLGWVPAEQSREVAAAGVYELHSINATGAGVKELLVPRPPPWRYSTEAPEYLALELRSRLGSADAFAPDDPAVTGVAVRITLGPRQPGAYTRLLDLSPGSPRGHRDGMLQVGGSFTDPQSGTALELESVRDGVARVRVIPREAPVEPTGLPPAEPAPEQPASPPAPPGPPPVQAAPPAAAAPDTVRPALRVRRVGRSRRIRVRATDAGAGLRVEVRLDRRVLAGRPGGRLTLRLPRRALRGRHVLRVVATDAAGNRRTLRFRLVRGALRPAR